jgi:dienelactone hydrolase
MSGRFVTGETIRTETVTGRFFSGVGEGPHPGVLVVHGGGGARGYEQNYAAMLAEHGYDVFCVEYFGAPGIRDSLVRIPLEEFENAAEWLLDHPDTGGKRVGVVGFSRGGEASLLVGSMFDTVGAVVSHVPSCYVWPAPSWMDGVGEDQPTWTYEGEPLTHLPIDKYVYKEDGIDEALGVEEPNASSLAIERSTATERKQATISVENIDGPVLLISGEQDTVWPSSLLAEQVAERLRDHEHPYEFEHLSFPEAGHAIRVPYRFDDSVPQNKSHKYGGTHQANARASARAWVRTLDYLNRIAG